MSEYPQYCNIMQSSYELIWPFRFSQIKSSDLEDECGGHLNLTSKKVHYQAYFLFLFTPLLRNPGSIFSVWLFEE